MCVPSRLWGQCQGTARAVEPGREGNAHGWQGNALPVRDGPSVPSWRTGQARGGSQVQLGVQIIGQVCGDEAGQAVKSICRSGSSLVRVARVRHSPAGVSIMMGALLGQTEESVNVSGVQTSGSMAKHSHSFECAGDQHSYNIAQAGTLGSGLSWKRAPGPMERGPGSGWLRVVRANNVC